MFYRTKIAKSEMIGGEFGGRVWARSTSFRPLLFTVWLSGLVFLLLSLCFSCQAQISQVASGNELTQVKITVSRSIGKNIVNSAGSGEPENSDETKIKTLPIRDVSILEAGDRLTIRFCEKCPGRSFGDLGYTRLLVFFVNPASVANDLKTDDPVKISNGGAGSKPSANSARSIAEIKFDGDLKSKKNLPKIYGEHQLIVPYRSIPLIFLVTNGDYKNELRRIILEKQADVLKLSEQATVLSQLPEAVSFLLEVKSALQTPAAVNPDYMQSFVQRAQYFRFNQTNCFQQSYLYRTDEAKLGCLVKNVNPDQLTAEIQDFNLTRLARTGASEAVAQLRLRYQGLSIFFDAAGAAIEIIGRLFKKKPLNLQLATLQTIQPAAGAQPVSQSATQPATQPAAQSAAQSVKKPSGETDYLSLRQFAVNAPVNAEKALIIAPLKWREQEEIIQSGDLRKIEVLAACRCLRRGVNTFWLETGNALVKRETKTVSIVLEKKSDSSQKLALANLPIDPADQSLTLALDDSGWRKVKDWRQATMKIIIGAAFEIIEKEIDLNVPQAPNWQILRNWNDPVKKGEKITLKLLPNTAGRECLDRIVLTDERKQSIVLSPLGEYKQEAGNQVSLHLSAKLLDKLQVGKIMVEVYENGEKTMSSGKMTFTLINK